MRFELNKPVLAIGYNKQYANGNVSPYGWCGKYMPWEDKLLSLELIKLNCIEHHKVPGDWDDVLQYDGFIFTGDKSVQPFYNQYPRASYGQISCAADNIFKKHIVEKPNSEKEILQYWGLKQYLEELLHGITDITPGYPVNAGMLQRHYD